MGDKSSTLSWEEFERALKAQEAVALKAEAAGSILDEVVTPAAEVETTKVETAQNSEEQAQRKRSSRLTPEGLDNVRRTFHAIDNDGSGSIELGELRKAMQ